ncbi:MAG: redoxin domain-containing protein [Planctomycetota bacterium]
MRAIPVRSVSAFVLLAFAAQLAAQDRRPLTHDDYDQWKSLRGQAYTQDGRWVAFQVEPQWGDGVLEIKQATGDTAYRYEFASGARFSADGRFALFSVGKSKVEERNKKIDELRKKAKEANKPAGEESKPAEGAEEEGGARRGGAAAGSGPGGRGGAGAFGGGRRGGGGAPAAGGGGPGAGGPGPGGPGGDDAASARDREWMLLELATGKVEALGKLKAAAFAPEAPLLFLHKEKPEAKKDEPKTDDKPAEGGKSEAGKVEAGEGKAAVAAAEPKTAAPAAAAGETGETKAGEAANAATAAAAGEAPAAEGARRPGGRRGGAASDPLEAKRPEGTELVVRNLATGEQRSLADVVGYGLSRNGKKMWYQTSAKKPAKDASYGVFVQAPEGGEPVCVHAGIARIGGVQFDRGETALTFTSDKETFADDKPVADVYLWDGGAAPGKRIAWAGGPGMPPGKRPAGGASFTRDGWTLTFEVQDAPAPEPLPILPEDKVTLDLWNWRDGLLQTMQQKRGAGERNPQWTAVYRRQKEELAVLGDDALRTLRPIGADGRWLLGTDSRAYEAEQTWDGRYSDVYVVDGQTGARKKLLTRFRGNVTNSPNGKYLVWFDANYHWQCHELATGATRDLTGALGVPFHDYQDDHPEPDAAFGLAGWTENDAAVLLYDEFDVWRLDPATGAAACVTDGFGRQNRTRLRIQPLPRDDDKVGLDDELLLAATNVETMAEGFFADSITRQQRPQKLLYGDRNYGDVARPKKSSRLFFTQGTFAEFPDLWTVAADFTDARRLSDANPQQKQFRWGKAELVHWIDGDGGRRKGVLVKPDDFDPTKKYPMMVYFYERMTQGLHNHVAPAPGTSPNAAYYVSNGYLWFMPDVVYEVGYPGASCVKCVVSGVQHLIAQGFVDEKAIGAAGHSWGGYQTAFLVTRTHIFAAVESGAPVCNMLSAYGGIRYESGMSRQFQYEMTQSRIGGTPWEYPLRYQENSPIHFADKVKTPVLILHNDQDGAVPWTQGIEYFTALRRLGKESYLFNYNGEGHGLRNRANMKDWTRRMAEYFAHHLKGEVAPKWMTDGVPFHERDAEKLPFAASYVDAHVKPAPAPKAAAKPAEAAAADGQPAAVAAVAAPTAAAGRVAAMAAGSAAPGKLARGDAAPDFACADATGAVRALADYRGKHVLVWFYPKADTPGCTAQGCGLRDAFADFIDRGCVVLGVSFDAAAANDAFAQKHGFPFPLLCDGDRKLALAYGAAETAEAKVARRVAALIGPDGKVVQYWSKVDPATFAAQVLAALPL